MNTSIKVNKAEQKVKNVKDWQLKKCIFLSADEYEAIVQELFGDDVQVEFSSDGIWVDSDDHYEEVSSDDINKGLAEYFGVTAVTSVHMDDCDEIGVWVCYK